ncbi:MAG: tetratricopeptide repeat-containing sensor histidine kinase [Aquaticitalea sp.]
MLLTCFATQSQTVLKSSKYDSILDLRSKGDDAKNSLDERYKYAFKAVKLSEETGVDSIILRSRRILSTVYLYQGKYEPFYKINHKNLKAARILNDTLVIGYANNNLGYYHQVMMQNDSAYYYYTNAIKLFELAQNTSIQITPLVNLSYIQNIEKDYLGSEENAIHGLTLLEGLPKTERNLDSAWIFNNLLGNISSQLGQNDRSMEYHEKAIAISNKMEYGLHNKFNSIHNQATVYRKKKNYKKALELYHEVINQKILFIEDPSFYPLLLDNIAFTKFEAGEKDYDEMEEMFKKAYRLSDSLDDQITKLAVVIDLTKFYKGQDKLDSALTYAKRSYHLAKDVSSNDILLESMIILSELTPGEEGKTFLKEHIKLSDSLLQHERGIRNKFARVQFETDQIEQENERIAQQRFWLLMIAIVLFVALFLLYIVITQRTKNKELKFERAQQETNEEIYNLMLSQQDKVDEARANEKKRISQEMHDGILGRLFGTRLSLDSLNFLDGKEAIQKRSTYISDLKDIEQDIRKISHDLNTDFVGGSGFMDIVENLVQKQTQAYQLSYEFYNSDDINWEDVSNKTKIHIYRILQETMQNIYKHAQATQIKISFHLEISVILLSIVDDGKGFAVNKSKKGIGLKNINSRVDEVNGTVQFDSEIDSGTTITIRIPHSK